jgi:hypothetical protein
MGGWEIGEGVGWGALGFGDYLDAGLPVAKSAPYPYTTCRTLRSSRGQTCRIQACSFVQLVESWRL